MNTENIAAIVADSRLTPDAVRLILYVAALGEGEHEIDSEQLNILLGCRAEKPVVAARKRAEHCGYLRWRQGGKGHANRYAYLAPEGEVKIIPRLLGGSNDGYIAPGGDVNGAPSTTTDTSPTPTPNAREPEQPPDTDQARLRSYLGEYSPAVDLMLRSGSHGPTWIAAVLGKYGPSGSQLQLLNGIPPDRHPAVLATALTDFGQTQKAFSNRYFDGFMRKAVDRERDGSGDRRPAGTTEKASVGATGTDASKGRRSGFIYE